MATGGSLNPKPMRDREVINRFCGFYLLGHKAYRGDMDDFLTQTLKYMNGMSEEDLKEMAQKFQLSMSNNTLVFDRLAFRKHNSPTDRRSVLNVALFDVFSTEMTKYSTEQVSQASETLREAFYTLMSHEELLPAITLGTNQQNRVRTRFEIISCAIEEVMENVKEN